MNFKICYNKKRLNCSLHQQKTTGSIIKQKLVETNATGMNAEYEPEVSDAGGV